MKKNVLIFPSGSENAMEIYDALRYSLHFNLFGISSKEDHTSFLYANFEIGSFNINDSNFIANFNKYLEKNNIDYIFPTHDSVALFLMENEKNIKSEIVCSPLETTIVARSKKKIYESLAKEDFVPHIYNFGESVDNFPIFAKPDMAAGGQGCILINNELELNKYKDDHNLVIMEYLPGEEYTVDCFTDKNGKLLFIGPRIRDRITMGISFSTKTIKCDTEFMHIAEALNSKFNFRGCWFFQVKRDGKNNLKLLEFSVRYAGTMALYRELGVNFALLSLFDRMEYSLEILFNDYNLILDRRLKSSFKLDYSYDTVYLDFDDTLIVNGSVNTTLIKFLYQSVYNNKKIILLTKHEFDIKRSLKKYKIHEELFDKIIQIADDKHKYEYINKENAIFIDNYYLERVQVRKNLNIPVFDVDAVECLLNESLN